MRIGIVGCGLIGFKRAASLFEDDEIVLAADLHMERAEKLVRLFEQGRATDNWMDVVREPDIEAVVIATTHDRLAEISRAAVESGKHIIVEKPAARNAEELKPVVSAAKNAGVTTKVGFNHRFHPAFQKAMEIMQSGELGPLMFIRGRYGHGGRVGYEKEWRANPEVSGGGELLDQGMHLIDLSRWFLGDLVLEAGYAPTYFWDMPADDNAFIFLKSGIGQAAWLHVSWTEWKNMFSFEIYGRDGKLHIEGLGGSYGTERLYFYKMHPEMGPPETVIYEYPGKDISWDLEYADFLNAVQSGGRACGDLEDALAALEIVGGIYGDRFKR